jgi:hypothetical protein
MDDNELITAVRDRFDPVRMHTRTETILARGRSLRRRRRVGVAGGALAIALGAGLAGPALTAGTAASPARVTLAAWTVDQRPDHSIAVSIRELRHLPALQRLLKADGVRVTITEKKIFPEQPKACAVREWSAFSGVKFEGTGRYFFILHPAKILPGTVLKITVIPGIKQPAGAPSAIPLVPSGAGKGSPRSQPAPVGIGYAYPGATPSVLFTPVRDVPSCLS